MSTPAESHVPRRLSGDERRHQLIDTAMHVFSQRGFTGTTTREIAAAAGVTEALIFRFFPTKEDLYAAILERKSSDACTDQWVGQLRAAADRGDTRAVIRDVVANILEHQHRDPEFLRLMLYSALEKHSFARDYRERHFAPLREFLLEFIRTQQERRIFRSGDPHRLVRAIFGIPVHESLIETLTPELELPRDGTAVELYTDFILAGLRAA